MDRIRTEQAIEKLRQELAQTPEDLKFSLVKSEIENALLIGNIHLIDCLLDELNLYIIGKKIT